MGGVLDPIHGLTIIFRVDPDLKDEVQAGALHRDQC